MSTHFPQTGQEIPVQQFIDELSIDELSIDELSIDELSVVFDPKNIPPGAIEQIVKVLDDSNPEKRDGQVTVGSFNERPLKDTVSSEICKDGKGDNCRYGGSGLWGDVDKATARLSRLLLDDRHPEAPGIRPEEFSATLRNYALGYGVKNLTPDDADRIASTFVQEDGRPDGKISQRSADSKRLNDFTQQFFSDWIDPKSYLLLRPKFSESERRGIAEALQQIFWAAESETRSQRDRPQIPQPTSGLLRRDGDSLSDLNVVQAGMIDPNAVATLGQIYLQLQALPPDLTQQAGELLRAVLDRISQNGISGDKTVEILNNVGRWQFALAQLSRSTSGSADPAVLRGVIAETSNTLQGILRSGIADRVDGTRQAVIAFQGAVQTSNNLRPLVAAAEAEAPAILTELDDAGLALQGSGSPSGLLLGDGVRLGVYIAVGAIAVGTAAWLLWPQDPPPSGES